MTELTPEERERIYEEEKAKREAEEEKEKKMKEKIDAASGCFTLVVILAFVVFFFSNCGGSSNSSNSSSSNSSNSSNSSSTTSKQPDKFDAYVMSQLFVKDALKAPSTAKFPVYSEDMVVDGGDGSFIVSAYVDAQNSFGAMMRSNYVCIMQYDKATDEWALKGLDIK